MNWLTLAFWALTALCLGLGVIMGISRGFSRSVWRLLLVVLCAVLAFVLRGVVTDFILGIKVGGETIEQTILSALPEDLAGMGDTALALVKLMVYVIMFVVLFYLFKLITWMILFPIGKIFIKNSEKRKAARTEGRGKVKKHRLLGGIVGLAQGVVIAICICMPLGGLVYQANTASAALNEMQTPSESAMAFAEATEDGEPSGGGSSTGSTEAVLPPEIQDMLGGYADSLIGKFYGNVCKSSFDSIASVKMGDEKIALSDVVSLAGRAPDLLKEVDKIGNALGSVDYSNPDSLNDLKNIMREFDELKDNLPDGEKRTLNVLMSEVVRGLAEAGSDMIGGGSDSEETDKMMGAIMKSINTTLDEIKFTDISFENEVGVIQEVVTNVTEMAQSNSVSNQDVATILEAVSDSDLIVPLMENISIDDLGVEGFDDETRQAVAAELDKIEQNDAETQRAVDALRKMLGISVAE